MTYEHRWYLCEIREVEEADIPDFSRVPADKREMVEARWKERLAAQKPERWKLWGPQIEGYARMPGVTINVLGPA